MQRRKCYNSVDNAVGICFLANIAMLKLRIQTSEGNYITTSTIFDSP